MFAVCGWLYGAGCSLCVVCCFLFVKFSMPLSVACDDR